MLWLRAPYCRERQRQTEREREREIRPKWLRMVRSRRRIAWSLCRTAHSCRSFSQNPYEFIWLLAMMIRIPNEFLWFLPMMIRVPINLYAVLRWWLESLMNFYGFLRWWSESLWISMVFDDDDQNPYEFLWFLTMILATLSGTLPVPLVHGHHHGGLFRQASLRLPSFKYGMCILRLGNWDLIKNNPIMMLW